MGLRKIWSIILILGILICPAHVLGREALTLSETHVENHQPASKEQPVIPLHAKAAVLMDADSGRVLYDKNGEEALPMASTTKIMINSYIGVCGSGGCGRSIFLCGVHA